MRKIVNLIALCLVFGTSMGQAEDSYRVSRPPMGGFFEPRMTEDPSWGYYMTGYYIVNEDGKTEFRMPRYYGPDAGEFWESGDYKPWLSYEYRPDISQWGWGAASGIWVPRPRIMDHVYIPDYPVEMPVVIDEDELELPGKDPKDPFNLEHREAAEREARELEPAQPCGPNSRSVRCGPRISYAEYLSRKLNRAVWMTPTYLSHGQEGSAVRAIAGVMAEAEYEAGREALSLAMLVAMNRAAHDLRAGHQPQTFVIELLKSQLGVWTDKNTDEALRLARNLGLSEFVEILE